MKRAGALKVPGSMAKMQDRYVGALALYDKAAAEMISAAHDGKAEHLVAGQQMSLHALRTSCGSAKCSGRASTSRIDFVPAAGRPAAALSATGVKRRSGRISR
jgi:uncharacterized low-complexity protein